MKYIKVLVALFSTMLGIQAFAHSVPNMPGNPFACTEKKALSNFKHQSSLKAHKDICQTLIEKIECKKLSISDKNSPKRKIKYRTGSKRYKNNFHRLYRIHPMRIWLKISEKKYFDDTFVYQHLSIPDSLKIRLHKDFCLISPRT